MTVARSMGLCAVLVALALFPLCSRGKEASVSFRLSSPAFTHQGAIPSRYTCDGEDVSPALQWSGVPSGAKSLALIVEDPDAPDPAAPQRVWGHWVLYNLPPDSDGLPESVTATQLPAGAQQGANDWKRAGYGGPCPPIGRHRYFHRLYALDTVLPQLQQPDKSALRDAMEGHVLGEAELIGTYQRSGS